MTLAAVMAHIEVGKSNAGVLQVVGDLAEAFGAAVIGVAFCQPMQIVYADGFASGYVIKEDRAQIEEDLQVAEREFRESLTDRVDRLEWRGAETFAPLADEIARQACGVDLIVTSAETEANPMARWRRANLGDLALAAGRPILIAPQALPRLRMNHVLLAWKDGPACRRAACNALPILARAQKVTIVECAKPSDLDAARVGLDDVQAWLRRHRVMAETLVKTVGPKPGQDAATLSDLLQEQAPDMVVAGAYGHARLREWAFGGVTRDLLSRRDRCVLLSH
jgi:nucleotide-binding universal stress UspA family protein